MLIIEDTVPITTVMSMLKDMVELPEKYYYNSVLSQVKINIKVDSPEERMLAVAKLQEELRELFSQPERKKRNQAIIKLLGSPKD